MSFTARRGFGGIGASGSRAGLGKEAARQWMKYGWETLRLHKIYLDTLDTDIRNIRINEAIGFRIEGILRDEVFFDGRYHDVLRMGLCR